MASREKMSEVWDWLQELYIVPSKEEAPEVFSAWGRIFDDLTDAQMKVGKARMEAGYKYKRPLPAVFYEYAIAPTGEVSPYINENPGLLWTDENGLEWGDPSQPAGAPPPSEPMLDEVRKAKFEDWKRNFGGIE